MNRTSHFESGEKALCGTWRACGMREGIDLRTETGRLSYRPVGRGGLAFEENGVFRLTTINGAGIFSHDGCWFLNKERLLCVEIGGERGEFQLYVKDGLLTLVPDRIFFIGECARLHWPTFSRIAGCLA